MLGTMPTLANRGVDVLRLDAAPFWNARAPTARTSRRHTCGAAFRALTRLAMPGLVLKAEAIVSPDLLVQYPAGTTGTGQSATSPTTTSSW